MNTILSFSLLPLESLNQGHRKRMCDLMKLHYNKVVDELFYADLDKKQWVGIIQDELGLLQGFTTFAINPAGSGTDHYHVLFSGDTIIAPEHWGTQVMMKGWSRAVGSIIATDLGKNWYWYLLSKGHRTFMYLPLFFEQYYPNPDCQKNEVLLKRIAADISLKIFGNSWKPKEGILRFEQSQGELKPEWAAATFQKKGSKYAQFFLERNPNFYQGEELVCLALLKPENIKRSAKGYFMEGMQQAVHLNFLKL